jgi:hypothetical protein
MAVSEAVVFEFCSLIEKTLNIASPPLSLIFRRLQFSESVVDFCERFTKVAMKVNMPESVGGTNCFKAVVNAARSRIACFGMIECAERHIKDHHQIVVSLNTFCKLRHP